MLKPSSNITPEMHGAMANEVNSRLNKAVGEIQQKYASGKATSDYSENGPTGAAYKAAHAEKLKQQKAAKAAKEEEEYVPPTIPRDDDDEEDDDEDYELRRIRRARLQQMKSAKQEVIENKAKGHGQYREIVQDEFLAEVTSSKYTVCHFYHREFPRCTIMNHHLAKLAPQHLETKFIHINAEKAPFFVDKLRVRTMPTLIFFVDGVATGKLIGFEGLSDNMPEGKEDEWKTVTLARALAAQGMINGSKIVDEDAVEAEVREAMSSMRQRSLYDFDDDDFNLDDD